MLVDQAGADRETVAQVQRCRQGQVDDLHVRVDRVVAAGPGVVVFGLQAARGADHRAEGDVFELARSAERRVGKECVSKCRSWWSQTHYTKNTYKQSTVANRLYQTGP